MCDAGQAVGDAIYKSVCPLCGVIRVDEQIGLEETPEELVLPCILAGTDENDIVLDPFNGSGTTGVVALKNKRKYLGVELNPEYVELSSKRLEAVSLEMSKYNLW